MYARQIILISYYKPYMSLPDFNTEGLLPDGVHPATEDELKERCVDSFTLSRSRNVIFQGLCTYRQELASLGICATQWIDGSFVDQKRRDPEDVDLVNFCDQAFINSLPVTSQQRIGEIIGAGSKTIQTHHCHTFVVMKYPDGHPMASKFEEKSND
jgi:hypothetical protein